MTPKQFQEFKKDREMHIAVLEKEIDLARKSVPKRPPRKELRPCRADDIKKGAVIWYDNGDEGWFWCIVEEPMLYSDQWKAYMADDGNRYGLDGAWVYK